MVLELIIGATVAVSLISFIGALTLALSARILQKILLGLVSLAAGTMLGAVFFDLLPESLELLGAANINSVLAFTLAGIISFFVIEKFIYWHHHHYHHYSEHPEAKDKKIRSFAYLNLIGDGVHNFFDGVIIAVSFVVSPQLGFVTTLAVALHEIPQEIGDFGLLIYGGFTKSRALFFNFLSALAAIAGAVMAFYFAAAEAIGFVLPFVAGGFLYIALTDLLPELSHDAKAASSIVQLAMISVGIAIMWQLTVIFGI